LAYVADEPQANAVFYVREEVLYRIPFQQGQAEAEGDPESANGRGDTAKSGLKLVQANRAFALRMTILA